MGDGRCEKGGKTSAAPGTGLGGIIVNTIESIGEWFSGSGKPRAEKREAETEE